LLRTVVEEVVDSVDSIFDGALPGEGGGKAMPSIFVSNMRLKSAGGNNNKNRFRATSY
jgi:hypothetical protein